LEGNENGMEEQSAPAAEPRAQAPEAEGAPHVERAPDEAENGAGSAEPRRASSSAASTAGGDSGDSGGDAETGTDGTEGAPGGPPLLGPDGLPRKKRRRGRRGGKRHKKKPANGAPGARPAAGDDDDDDEDDDAGSDAAASESSHAGEGAHATRAEGAQGGDAQGEGAQGDGARTAQGPRPQRAPRPPRPPRQRQQSRPATGEGATDADATDASTESAQDSADAAGGEGADGTGAPRKRRRRRRGGAKKPTTEGGETATEGEGAQAKPKPAARKPAAASSGGSTRLAARAMRKDRGRGGTGGGNRRPQRRRLTEADAQRLRGGAKTMLVHEHDERTQIAILEEGALIEHYVARRGQRTTMAGNVYLGRVQNVLPGMEAAFVDFGRGRNGVLYAGEVNYSEEDLEGEAPRIEKALKSGQSLMVQVTKDPIGTKGARLTAQISLAGRFMVLAPEQQVSGISRRLAEGERARLRTILREIAPKEHGVIVRTAADGADKEALERDLKNLLKIWEQIAQTAKKAKAPHLLYAEPELVSRVVRDIFSDDFEHVVVDSRAVYDEVRTFLEETAPELLGRLELHEGALPLFETYRVTEQLHKALERKVWLPSGGSLVIDRTEALTVVDVNTGKFTGKGGNLEETVFKNNLEAAEEVARQLRLRDIGGIIVIDFIDMIDPKNQQEMLRTLKRALSKDKTRSQVFDVSSLGLVEMTRKRVSEGLLDSFSEPCPNCEGRGIVITHQID
jgi:ribonuclease E